MSWAGNAKSWIEWGREDEARVVELQAWLEPEFEQMTEDLLQCLSSLDGVKPLMANARFAQRLQTLVHEWLTGLVDVRCEDGCVERRQALGEKLAHLDIALEDLVFLEWVACQRMFSLASERLQGRPEDLSQTLYVLNKAMMRDRVLVHAGYLELHDAELEQALLDRFLSITGFSPTLYESLAEAWRWSQGRIGRDEP